MVPWTLIYLQLHIHTYRMGTNFRGVLIFVDFVRSLHPRKTVAWAPCTHACNSYMPRKYKPSKSSYLFKPRKFKPSNLSTRTVYTYACKYSTYSLPLLLVLMLVVALLPLPALLLAVTLT